MKIYVVHTILSGYFLGGYIGAFSSEQTAIDYLTQRTNYTSKETHTFNGRRITNIVVGDNEYSIAEDELQS